MLVQYTGKLAGIEVDAEPHYTCQHQVTEP